MDAWNILDEATRGYLAGIIDGEGYICITRTKLTSKRSIRHSLVLGVSMSDAYPIELFHNIFGGSIGSKKDSRSNKWRLMYRWSVCANMAKEILILIEPYLHIKKQQAKLGIEFYENISHITGRAKGLHSGMKSVSDEELEKRNYYYEKLNSLNYRKAR